MSSLFSPGLYRRLVSSVLTATIIAGTIVAPTVPTAAAQSPMEGLAGWTFTLHVARHFGNSDGSRDYKYEVTYVDDSVESTDVRWAAFNAEWDHQPCFGGADTFASHGSGTGAGTTTPISSSHSARWGLDPTTPWTAMLVYTLEIYQASDTFTKCRGDVDKWEAGRSPIQGELFLPGTWETLSALPIGTTISNTYNQGGHSQGEFDLTTVTYTATKGLATDSDGDGLNDAEELGLGTDPHNPDTDGDGLLDGQEVNEFGTDPLNPDTDGDGLWDGEEVETGVPPVTPPPPLEPCIREGEPYSRQVNAQSSFSDTRMSYVLNLATCETEREVRLLTEPEVAGWVDPDWEGLGATILADYLGVVPTLSWEYLGTDGGYEHSDSNGPYVEWDAEAEVLWVVARGRFQHCMTLGIPVVKIIAKGLKTSPSLYERLSDEVRRPLEWSAELGEGAFEEAVEWLPDSVKRRLAAYVISGMLLGLDVAREAAEHVDLSAAEVERLQSLLDVLVATGAKMADDDKVEEGLHMDGLSVTYCNVDWQPEYVLRVPRGEPFWPEDFNSPLIYPPTGFELVED